MHSTALLTDHYELTMVAAARRAGTAGRRCVFELFSRSLPAGRRYGVVAGVGRMLEALPAFRFSESELAALGSVVDDDTLAWLADFRFTGSIRGYAEGDLWFAHSPLLVVEASFAEAVVLETLLLSIYNHDCAVAAAASRMVTAAGSRPCVEMGSRRTHEEAAVAAARAAYLAGFTATSNLAARHRYGVPTTGTAAHAFTLLHDTEAEAFAAQVTALGVDTTLLVDTYEVEAGVRAALAAAGPDLGAVRIDSGDLAEVARRVRDQLDEAGAPHTRIVATSDLDEHRIEALAEAPLDAYGVGTHLVTGSGHPTAALVYKLVAREDAHGTLAPVAKRSVGKESRGGRKEATRRLTDGVAVAEVVGPAPGEGRPLLVDLVRDGEPVGTEALVDARARHRAAVAELPAEGRLIAAGDPAIPTLMV